MLGFFRIWEIPGDCVTGLLGHFRPSIPIRRFELESHGIWDIDRSPLQIASIFPLGNCIPVWPAFLSAFLLVLHLLIQLGYSLPFQ